MDGGMAGWVMDGWMDGWMNGWSLVGQTMMDGWMKDWFRWMDGWSEDRWLVGQMDGWMEDGWERKRKRLSSILVHGEATPITEFQRPGGSERKENRHSQTKQNQKDLLPATLPVKNS